MTPGSSRRGLTAVAFLTVLAVVACGDDDPTGTDPTILGSWEATRFLALGTDLVADGMTFDLTLAESGTYTVEVGNDQVGVCPEPGATDCTQTGPFTYTASQITLDAGQEGAVTFGYDLSGSEMTWVGAIRSVPVTVTFVRR